MANAAQNVHNILSNLPPDTVRVQVQDASGKTRWKKPSEIVSSDTILFNSGGDPIVMKGSPGRRQTVVPLPVNPATASIVQYKDDSMKKDPLLRSVKDSTHSLDILDNIIRGISEEAASLHFEREEAERKGNDTSKISLRRVNALKAAADVYLKRREQMAQGSVDLESEAFEKVFLFIVETIRDCMMSSGVSREHVDTVFAKVAKHFDDSWKAEARARMKQA